MNTKGISLFIIFLLIFSAKNSYSQTAEIDSLKKVAASHADDSIRFTSLVELFSLISKINIKNSEQYLKQAEEIAVTKKDPYYIGSTLYNRAAYFIYMGKRDSAAVYADSSYRILKNTGYKKSLALALSNKMAAMGSQNAKKLEIVHELYRIYTELKDTSGLLYALNSFASNYTFLNNYDSAQYYSLMALDIGLKRNKPKELTNIYKQLCNLYFEKNDFSKAIENGIIALKYAQQSKDANNEIWLYITIAGTYLKQNDLSKAVSYYKKARIKSTESGFRKNLGRIERELATVYMKQMEYDSAFICLQNSIAISKELHSLYGEMAATSGFAEYYMAKKEYAEALDYARSTKDLVIKLDSKTDLSISVRFMSICFLELGMIDSAYHYGIQVYNLAKELNDISERAQDAELLSRILEKKGEHIQALNYYREYKMLEDSIFNSDKTKIIAEIETKYATEKKEQEITLLQKQREVDAIQLHLQSQLVEEQELKSRERVRELFLAKKENEIIGLTARQNSLELDGERKENEKSIQKIALLNKEKELQLSELAKQKTIRNSIVGGSVMLIAFSAFAFSLYKRRRDASIRQKEAEYQLRVAETEMKALRAQVNPHFIFNALQSIYEYLQLNKTKEAGEYLIKFSKLIRLVLNHSRKTLVPLSEDLQALELYMDLENARLENKFAYSINIDTQIDSEEQLFPPMILQPLVENSIRHGLSTVSDGKLNISLKKIGDTIECSVENSSAEGAIRSIPESFRKSDSLGTKLIEERLAILGSLKNLTSKISSVDLSDKAKRLTGYRTVIQLPEALLTL